MTDEAVAFWFHGPGLRVMRGYRFPVKLVVGNAALIALTFALALAAYFFVHPVLAVMIWLSGHFGWSVYLARLVPSLRAAKVAGAV